VRPDALVAQYSQGIETNDSQFPRDDLYIEPASLLELMSLGLGDEILPYVQVLGRPLVGATQENVMRHDVIVAKGRYYGNLESMLGVRIVIFAACAENVCEFSDQ
jgi:hypothetical protein